MQAELISIGDELLIGQTINTNAAWLGMELSLMGISVSKSVTIQDDESAIKKAIDTAFSNSEIVIITGGLGPTKDDITKYVLCDYFQTELVINEEVLKRVEEFFTKRGRKMLDVNIQQAALPKTCEILDNLQGTASGMWFDYEGKVLISLPGVPYEMKGIMWQFGFDKIKNHFKVKSIYHQTILLQGIGESFLADRMKDWENSIRSSGLGLAYLPAVSILKLRITSRNGIKDKAKIDAYFKELKEELPQYCFGEEKETLSGVLGRILRDKKLTIGTVESCTGGALATSLVSISGASNYFLGSFLTYANDLKIKLVGVSPSVISSHGVVSKEVVEEMALLGAEKLGVDICLSTSGVAGPDGGTEEKPVGTVWVGMAIKGNVSSFKFQFGDNRQRNIELTVNSTLNLLRCKLLEISIEKK
ncbi:MAG: CinA family nicotinamide mononucleotide deamidase-related protein [Flavobacteriia bacterium]|nr:CinA family nicotinamide mononucleotide deamidase-related protein [Flavobacteriia bacterium]